ncbi:MAG: glutaredoxin family protein, partial [Nitrospirales bacterium]|nr:glutaredoxin family protein [Nitrospirales bacterium]
MHLRWRLPWSTLMNIACSMSQCYSESIPFGDTMMEVTILSREKCHLCHVALRIARHVQVDIPFILRSVDITHDITLLAL